MPLRTAPAPHRDASHLSPGPSASIPKHPAPGPATGIPTHLPPGPATSIPTHLSPGPSASIPTHLSRGPSASIPAHLSLRTALRLALVTLLIPALATAAPVAPAPAATTTATTTAPAPTAAPDPALTPAPTTTQSDGPRAQLRVLLLPRREGDPLPPATDNSLRDSLRDGLRRAGAALIEAAPIGAGECGDRACLARLRASIGLRYVVRATLAVVDRDYSLHLELLDTRTGESVNEFREHCPLCGLAEARTRVADGAAALLAPLQGKPIAAPVLTIRSDPPGAQIELDGLPVGRAPFERSVAPGPHRVRATLPGHVASERDLTLADGEASTLQISLTPAPKPPPRGRLMLALGVPLAVLGVTLLALDDRKLPLGCAGTDCQRTMQVMWPGALALATGAVLTSLGAARLHRARRARAPR